VTAFEYDGDGNLTSITDPDDSRRTFRHDEIETINDEPLVHLITSQTLKRGNDPDEESSYRFIEDISYNEFGRS